MFGIATPWDVGIVLYGIILCRAEIIAVGVPPVLYVAAILVAFEPEERRPGPRVTGKVAEVQDTDWSFLRGRNLIFVETRTGYLPTLKLAVSRLECEDQRPGDEESAGLAQVNGV